mgnify:CR=1 FL=1
MPKKEKPIHKVSFDSMVSVGCLCGFRWHNHELKGKSDRDLIEERDCAFLEHCRDMEKAGF